MNSLRVILLSMIIITNSIINTGCWNYREIDHLAVVAGVAIDKGIHEKFSITVEIAEISADEGSSAKSSTLTMEGKTIFDASRHQISVAGKKLYWSHAKVVIISEELAVDGVVQVLDWFNRDAETRADIHIIISKGLAAKEILAAHEKTEKVKSFVLDDILKNQQSLSNSPPIEIWKFTNHLMSKGVAATASVVDLRQVNGEKVPHVMGTAIFKGDKLIGFIDGNETKDMLFIQNQIKGGILVVGENEQNGSSTVSLEIFKSKTEIEPIISNGNITMNVNIKTIVAIDEIEGAKNVIEDEGRKYLEYSAEKAIKDRTEYLIRKVQSVYGTDIFGFGAKLRERDPKLWNTMADNWGEIFKSLNVNVNTDVHIRNSAMMAKSLEVGD